MRRVTSHRWGAVAAGCALAVAGAPALADTPQTRDATSTLLEATPLEIAFSSDTRIQALNIAPGDWVLDASEWFSEAELTLFGSDGARLELSPARARLTRSYLSIRVADDDTWLLRIRPTRTEALRPHVRLQLLPAAALPAAVLASERRLAALSSDGSDDANAAILEAARTAAAAWESAGHPSRAAERWLVAASHARRVHDNARATRIAQRALRLAVQADRSLYAGESASVLALIATEEGDFDQAASLLPAAIDWFAPHYAGRAVNPGESNRCFLLFVSQALRQAAECYDRLLAQAQAFGDETREIRYLNLIGGTYVELGDNPLALPYLERGLAHPDLPKLGRTRARLANNTGLVLKRLGRLQAALQHYRVAIDVAQAIGNEARAAQTVTNMALIYARSGQMAQAINLLETAHATLERLQHPRRGNSAKLLAVALNEVGAHDRVSPLLGTALSLAQQRNDAPELADIRIMQAMVQDNTGQSSAALADLVSLLAELPESDRVNRAKALTLAGRIRYKLQQSSEAVSALDSAAQLVRSMSDPMLLAEILAIRSAAHWQAGDADAAIADGEAAIAALDQTVANIDSLELRAGAHGTAALAYQTLIDVHVSRDALDTALETAERFRARTLVDVLARGNSAPVLDIPAELEVRRLQLLSDINGLESARRRGERSAGSAELVAQLDALDAEIAERDPRYKAFQRKLALGGPAIRALLDADTVLLQYTLGPDRSYGWLLGADSVDVVRLPAAPDLDPLARDIHDRLSRRDPPAGALREAGTVLLAPLEDALAGARRVIIVPDGSLHYVPFEALTTRAGDPPVLDGKSISYLPSATSLALLRELRSTPSHRVAVLADPVFGAGDVRFEDDRRPLNDTSEALTRLRLGRLEANAIEELTRDAQVTTATGFDASADFLRSESVAAADIVHLAAHGFVDSEVTARSGVALSMYAPDGTRREGFVGLRDIMNLRLNAELVTLSACSTALGKYLPGEGLLGLTRGFMFAGARRVVASLWAVEDRATAELMRHFYTALLRDRQAPDAALAYAKRQLRRESRWRHPYYWSGFVLVGDWQPFEVGQLIVP